MDLMKKKVILVDENDQPVGEMEKLAAHLQDKRHRAFSIFIFDRQANWLLQRRALSKYHCPGLWSNACCSHPAPGDELLKIAKKRLREEMGFSCPLDEIFSFSYRVEFEKGLTENEFDHVLIGEYEGRVAPSKEEAEDWCWISKADLFDWVEKKPEEFTFWFKKIYRRVAKARKKGTKK